MNKLKWIIFFAVLTACGASQQTTSENGAGDAHRPQIHFSPRKSWMNDPNGMVYLNGTYHLFFQYYPDSTVWGPMHWGHATSKDLVHWEEQPIALYPDSLGYIFSGSAVADINNTSGFGVNGKTPLVAIFTHHDPKGEREKRNDFQNQSIAYSTDEGKTWTKYAGNPVVKNPGIRDFRDPKVSWYEPQKKWIMTLATLDRITFYSSKDLKTWTKESEFGKDFGAHGGVWECPDLFPLTHEGKTVWILFVSINPGGPNRGSATQYFTGDFDGKTFTPYQTDTRWVDYGPDNYAGITWSNTGDRKIFIGWMSNWQYANVVPTHPWRSATTIPRDLSLTKIGEKYFVTSMPSPELEKLAGEVIDEASNINAADYRVKAKTGEPASPALLTLHSKNLDNFSVVISNTQNEKVVVGYDKSANNYYVDRRESGKINFEKGFATRLTAPRIATDSAIQLTLVIDKGSVELFGDNGLSVMTCIFFPNADYTNVDIRSASAGQISSFKYTRLKSMFR